MNARRTTFVPVPIDVARIEQATRLYNSAVAWSAVNELFEGVMFR